MNTVAATRETIAEGLQQIGLENGYAVLDESESPVALDPTLPWHLLPNGVIDQAGTQKGNQAHRHRAGE